MCETFVICLIPGTFVICLIIPFEHWLAVPKNIIVIIMMIIVCFETFIQCECCIGSNTQCVQNPVFEGPKTRPS